MYHSEAGPFQLIEIVQQKMKTMNYGLSDKKDDREMMAFPFQI